MDELARVFENLFVITREGDILSIGSITSFIFVISSLLAIRNYTKSPVTGFSRVATTGVVSLTYLLCGMAVEYIRPLAMKYVHINFESQLSIYPLFSLVLLASIASLYFIHKAKSVELSPIFWSSIGVFILLALMNLLYWVVVIAFNLRYEVTWVDYAYWFGTNYLSLMLAVACFYPSILSTRARFFVNPLSAALR